MPGESLPKFLAALVQPSTRCGGRSDRRFENTAQFCRTGIPYIILRVEYLPGEANESDTRERVCLRLRPWASEDHPKRAAAVYPDLRRESRRARRGQPRQNSGNCSFSLSLPAHCVDTPARQFPQSHTNPTALERQQSEQNH